MQISEIATLVGKTTTEYLNSRGQLEVAVWLLEHILGPNGGRISEYIDATGTRSRLESAVRFVREVYDRMDEHHEKIIAQLKQSTQNNGPQVIAIRSPEDLHRLIEAILANVTGPIPPLPLPTQPRPHEIN